MKKVLLIGLLGLCISLFTVPVIAETVAIYTNDKAISWEGWSVFGSDDDIDATAELITELDTTYAQLAVADTIEVIRGDGADITQTVTVWGIRNSDDVRVSEVFSLDGGTVNSGSVTFKYIDQASVDAECAGAVTVRRATGDTFITSIPIGVLQATMVQHFNGTKTSYITNWRASVTTTTGSVTFQLRYYPDDADCLDATDGFIVLDEILLTNVLSTQDRSYIQPWECPAGGYIAVYGTGSTTDCDGSVTLQGFDF